MIYTAKAQAALEQRAKTDKALAKANENLKDALEEEHQRQLKARAKETEVMDAALEEGAGAISWIFDLATRNGMADKRLNLSNSQLFIESELSKAKAELAELDQLAQEKGCSSIRFLVKGYSQITNKARKTLEYFRQNLPEWAAALPTGLKRLAGEVGNQKIERYLTFTFYPLLEQYLDSDPEQWAVASIQKAWAAVGDLGDLETIYGWMCDRLEGLEEERPTDQMPLDSWITDLHVKRLGPQANYGEGFIPSIAAFAQKANIHADRGALDDIETRHAGYQLHWVLKEFTNTGLDRRVLNGLEVCGYAPGGTLKDTVTLDLYLECFWAVKELEDAFENHEDAYEVVVDAVARYEQEGNFTRNIDNLLSAYADEEPTASQEVDESEEDFDDYEDAEALEALKELGVI